MTTLIARGYALLNRVAEPAAAESVRYLRNAIVVSDALPAIIAAADITQVLEGDGTIIGRQLQVRLKRSHLVIDNVPIQPEPYDRIEWIHDGRTIVMEVLKDAVRGEAPAVDERSDWVPASVKIKERTPIE